MPQISNETALRWVVNVIDQVQVQGTLEQAEQQVALGKAAKELLAQLLEGKHMPLEAVE